MAAYAAAVSLMHIIDLLKNHPSPPISLDKQQLHSLTEAVTFMQEFLESYVSPSSYSDEADLLEMRIADAAYAAEDVIESYIVDSVHLAAASTTRDDDDDDSDDDDDDGDDDNDDEDEEDFDGEAMGLYIVDNIIHLAGGTTHDDEDDDAEQIRYINFYEGQQKEIEAMDMIKKEAMEMDDAMESYTVSTIQLAAAAAHHEDEQIRYFNFYQGLQKVIEAIDIINKEAMEMVREKGGLLEAELQGNAPVHPGFKSTSIERKSEMVGFDDEKQSMRASTFPEVWRRGKGKEWGS